MVGTWHINLYWRPCSPCLKCCCLPLPLYLRLLTVLYYRSEMMMSSDLKSPIGLMMSWHHGDTPEGNNSHILVVQTISFLALSYMSICTYWPLFRINLGWAFRLEGRQMSPTSALIFNGEYFSRLQFSLGYNFLLFLHIPRYVCIQLFSSHCIVLFFLYTELRTPHLWSWCQTLK